MDKIEKTEIFLDLYKRLEQAAIDEYGFPNDGRAVSELERLRQYDDIRREIKYCREVRNLLSHNEKIDGDFCVEPSAAMIDLLNDTIRRVENPDRCFDFATKPPNIITADINDFVLPYMGAMSRRGFSHIPIVEKEKVVSVFSASTPFSYMLEKGALEVDESTTFYHFVDYLPFGSHSTEAFRFLARDTLLAEAEVIFMESLKQARRIAMMFITENGSENESLLGIITPHDIIGK